MRDFNTIATEALKYSSRSSFKANSQKYYRDARLQGMLDDVCSHMTGRAEWNKDTVQVEALKYNKKIDFKNGNKSAYRVACKLKIIDDVCSHMDNKTKWTEELLYKEALKYTRRVDFKNNSRGGYCASQRFGITDKICEHMEYSYYWSDNNVIYIWRVKDTNIYKIGVTSNALGDNRIVDVARSGKLEAEIVLMSETKDKASDIEFILHEHFKEKTYSFDNKFDGHTEFFELLEGDITTAKRMICQMG